MRASDRRMRIGLFVPFFPQLSETFVIDQAAVLVDRGHDLSVFCLAGGVSGYDHPVLEQYGILAKRRILMSAEKFRRDKLLRASFRFGRHFPESMRRLRPLLRQDIGRGLKIAAGAAAMGVLAHPEPWPWTFDVIQVHFGHMAVVADALREMGLIRGPLVATFHGSDVSVVARTDPRRYGGVFRRAERLTANSAFLRDRLLALGAPADRTTQLPTGVDLSRFRLRHPLPDGPPRFLTVARLSEEKGVAVALHAMAALRSRGVPFRYTVVGEGPLHDELERLTGSLGIQGSVEFLGPLPQDGVLDALASHHVFLLPAVEASSGAVEAQGRVLMEAQATGLPVVATSVGGIPETVGPGAGRLVPPRDSEALTEALIELVEQRPAWEDMGRAGRLHVEEHFDLQRIGQRLEAIYESLHVEDMPA